MSLIRSVAITEFEFTVNDTGLEQAATGTGDMAYVKGSRLPTRRFAVRISTDDGLAGEYVTTDGQCRPTPHQGDRHAQSTGGQRIAASLPCWPVETSYACAGVALDSASAIAPSRGGAALS